MIKSPKYIALLLLSALMMLSCESDLDLKIPEGGGQLVIFSFLTADSVMSVHLSKSVSHSSVDDFERVYDGYIAIKRNGISLDSFAFPDDKAWIERPNITVKEGDVFDFSAGTLSGLNVRGETVVPEATKILSIDSMGLSVTNNVRAISYELEFADAKDKDNYYQLLITHEKRDSLNKVTEFQDVNYYKDDELFYIRDQEGSLLGGIDFRGSFSDYIIEDESYRIQIRIPEIYLLQPGYKETRVLKFYLLSLSQDYYNYLRSRVVAEYNSKLPVVDPIKIHSNIQGGLGLIGSVAIASDSIVIIGNAYN